LLLPQLSHYSFLKGSFTAGQKIGTITRRDAPDAATFCLRQE
jgi:hypothetical protein